jgi:hypothetical protein
MTNNSWNLFYHRLAEAFKHVYSKRTYFGDEQFTDMTHVDDEFLIIIIKTDIKNQIFQ